MEKVLKKWEKSFSIEKQLPLLSSGGTRNYVNFLPTSNPCQNSSLGACSAHLISLLLVSLCVGQYSHYITWAVSLVWNVLCFPILKSFSLFNLFLNICYFLYMP